MSFFSCDMWVPLWEDQSYLWGKNIRCKRSIGESRWLVWRLWGIWCWYLHVCRVVFIIVSPIPRLVCISWGEMRVHSYVPFSWLHTTVVLLTTFNIYNLGYKLVWFLREKRWVMSGKMTNPLKTVLLPRLWWRLGCVSVCLSVSLPSGDSPVVGTSCYPTNSDG